MASQVIGAVAVRDIRGRCHFDAGYVLCRAGRAAVLRERATNGIDEWISQLLYALITVPKGYRWC